MQRHGTARSTRWLTVTGAAAALFSAVNSRIRKIDLAGIITTVAGTGEWGYSGDGGAATHATLTYPSAVAVVDHAELFGDLRDGEKTRSVVPSSAR